MKQRDSEKLNEMTEKANQEPKDHHQSRTVRAHLLYSQPIVRLAKTDLFDH